MTRRRSIRLLYTPEEATAVLRKLTNLRPNSWTPAEVSALQSATGKLTLAAGRSVALVERWECPKPDPGIGFIVVEEEFDQSTVPHTRIIKKVRLTF